MTITDKLKESTVWDRKKSATAWNLVISPQSLVGLFVPAGENNEYSTIRSEKHTLMKKYCHNHKVSRLWHGYLDSQHMEAVFFKRCVYCVIMVLTA